MKAHGRAWLPLTSRLKEQPDHHPALFTLTVSDSISCGEADLLFRDSNLREEEAKLDVYRITPGGYLFEMSTPFTDRLNCRLYINDDFHTAEATLYGNDM